MLRILCLLGVATLVCAADVKDFSKTVPLDPGGRFSLDTYKGAIHVSAWDQPRAEIQAHIVADPSGWFAMPVENVEIRVDASPGSVRVKTEYHHPQFMEGSVPNVYYTIHVPRSASLSIKDYKSESDIAGMERDIEFETYKGTAHIMGVRGALRVNTYKGDVRATFANFGGANLETYKGEIELLLPRTAAFDVAAKLGRRANLDSDFPRTMRSTREREVRGSVNGGGRELRANSYRGTIRLRSAN